MTLPASPTTGSEVIIVVQTGQAATNNITLGRNGSKIKGQCQDGKMTTNRGGLRLVYSGSSQGWITATAGNDAKATTDKYIVASGGTETTCGNFKIHTFNSTSNFVVASVGNTAGGGAGVSYIVVAGGGGGGSECGGGGAADGWGSASVRRSSTPTTGRARLRPPRPSGSGGQPCPYRGLPPLAARWRERPAGRGRQPSWRRRSAGTPM